MQPIPEFVPVEDSQPEPKVRAISVAGHVLSCGKLKMGQIEDLIYNQQGSSLEVVNRAWKAIEASLTWGGEPFPSIDDLRTMLDADEFRELYLFVARHSKAYLTA